MPIDLDAARAARREAKKESPQVVFGGQTFELPIEIPYELVEKLQSSEERNAPRIVLQELFGPKQWQQFNKLQPTLDDMNVLFESLAVEYGITAPQSPAS